VGRPKKKEGGTQKPKSKPEFRTRVDPDLVDRLLYRFVFLVKQGLELMLTDPLSWPGRNLTKRLSSTTAQRIFRSAWPGSPKSLRIGMASLLPVYLEPCTVVRTLGRSRSGWIRPAGGWFSAGASCDWSRWRFTTV